MADEKSTDLLMMFYIAGTEKLPGESRVAIRARNQDDALMEGFETGYFFEVDSFDFGLGVLDSDSGGDKKHGAANVGGGKRGMHSWSGGLSAQIADGEGGANAAKPKRKFEKFFSGMSTGLNYEVDVQFSFTRQMDVASPTLFERCGNMQAFKGAVLVKRKFTGNKAFHEAFFRMEFDHVLLTGIDWDDGEVVKEKCSFICRQLRVIYRQQMGQGKMGDMVPGLWNSRRKVAATS
jgi:type VI protein secretion system component Hcp